MHRSPTDLEVIRALAYNESLRAPEPQELTTDEVLALFDDPEPEIVVTHDEMADFWTFGREAYHATFGDYDLDCLVGSGPTPLDAIVDLLDREEFISELSTEAACKLTARLMTGGHHGHD